MKDDAKPGGDDEDRSPLSLDGAQHGWFVRCLRRWHAVEATLARIVPGLVASGPPYSWDTAHVHQQIGLRSAFPEAAWRAAGFDRAWAEKLCRAIQGGMHHPNHHYGPDDPLALVFLDQSLDSLEATVNLEQTFWMTFEPADYTLLVSNGATMWDLAALVRARAADYDPPFGTGEDAAPADPADDKG